MAPSRGPAPTASSSAPTTLARTLHQTLTGHKGPVNVSRYAKGSARYVLSGGQDRTVRLWNPNIGTEIRSFTGHGYEVLSISVAPDNAKFASSGGDRSVFLWDVTAGVTTRRFPGHTGKVHTVEFNEDASVLASGSFDASVKLWDVRSQSRQPIQTLEEARDTVQTLHIGPSTITSGSVDGHVRTYDLRMGELRSDYIGHPITALVPTQDLQTLLITSLDGCIRLLDARMGALLASFIGHKHAAYRCRAVFGHTEASVVCGDEDGRVWAWDLVDGRPLAPNPPPKVHEGVITWTEHHPGEAGELVTASADGTVKVWRWPESSAPED